MFGLSEWEVRDLIEEGKKDFSRWPYTYVKGTALERYIDTKVADGVDKALSRLYRLAEDLGYEWQPGGKWVKTSKKVKKGKKK